MGGSGGGGYRGGDGCFLSCVGGILYVVTGGLLIVFNVCCAGYQFDLGIA